MEKNFNDNSAEITNKFDELAKKTIEWFISEIEKMDKSCHNR